MRYLGKLYQMHNLCPSSFFVCVWNSRVSKYSNLYLLTGVVPLATYMRIYKKGDIVDIKVVSAVLCREKLKQWGPVQFLGAGLFCCLCHMCHHKCPLLTLGAILEWQCCWASSSTSVPYAGVCGVLEVQTTWLCLCSAEKWEWNMPQPLFELATGTTFSAVTSVDVLLWAMIYGGAVHSYVIEKLY